MKHIQVLMIAAFCLTLFSAGCGSKKTPAVPEAAEEVTATDLVTLSAGQIERAGLQTAKVERRTIQGMLHANGVLDVPPQNLVSISAPFGGFLMSTPLLQGSRVNRGQQIALLQDPEFVTMQQQYLEDRSQLAYLSAEFERQQALALENVNARKTLEKAKADFETMQARIAGQRAKLEMLNIDLKKLEDGQISKSAPIYAPISGFVTQVHVNIGSHVRPEDVLFKIADTGHLHAELTVYEQDLPLLGMEQKVRLRISNESEWRSGTVHLIGREVGTDHSVKVHVHLDQEDTELVPGTFLEAEIVAAGHEVAALPNRAIVQFEGNTGIFVQEGMADGERQFRLLELKTGLSDSSYTEVLLPSGFDMQSVIVTQGSYDLLAKLKNTQEEE